MIMTYYSENSQLYCIPMDSQLFVLIQCSHCIRHDLYSQYADPDLHNIYEHLGSTYVKRLCDVINDLVTKENSLELVA